MNILAIDTSSITASCAYMEESKVIGEYFTNAGLTHSKTILPMIQSLFLSIGKTMDDVGCIAVSIGPGSFTGLRIGLATVKGLAFKRDILAIPVSTLEALAYNLIFYDGLIVPVMDARRSQVYTAAYRCNSTVLTCELPPATLSIAQLGEYIKSHPLADSALLVGDGAVLCKETLTDTLPQLQLAPTTLRYLRAGSVGLAALNKGEGAALPVEALAPQYLRIPQAQRELNEKNKGQTP